MSSCTYGYKDVEYIDDSDEEFEDSSHIVILIYFFIFYGDLLFSYLKKIKGTKRHKNTSVLGQIFTA